MSAPDRSRTLIVADVDEARTLLRRSDAASRRAGLELIDGWVTLQPDTEAAEAILRAATLAYPVVRSHPVEPGVRFARVLCEVPRSVGVIEVEAAYLLSSEHVRRVLLHLLALRRDPAGVTAIAYLIGPDGPVDLVPLPAGELLTPVLDVVSAPALVPTLLHLAAIPGWTWHAGAILEQLVAEDRLDAVHLERIDTALGDLVGALVTTCDRARLVSSDRPDAVRAERHRLRRLASLLGARRSPAATVALLRMLGSADPQVSAIAAAAAVSAGCAVAPDRIELLAREPVALAELWSAFGHDAVEHIPAAWRTGRARAEAELLRWLSGSTELGRTPDEVEHVAAVAAGERTGDGSVHLFRFRMRSPHWSSARGWMIGAAGPYRCDGTEAAEEAFASSVYLAEDDADADGHLDAILDSLGVWPDGDGA